VTLMASEEQLEVKQSDFPAPLISIIIPAHNEADRIAQTIAALRRAAEQV